MRPIIATGGGTLCSVPAAIFDPVLACLHDTANSRVTSRLFGIFPWQAAFFGVEHRLAVALLTFRRLKRRGFGGQTLGMARSASRHFVKSLRLSTAQPTLPPSRRARARARVSGENQRRWAIDRLIPYAKNARTHT